MKPQDAIRIDEDRGGKGIAQLIGSEHIQCLVRHTSVHTRIGTKHSGAVWGDFTETLSLGMLTWLQSFDWEPVTPEPEPAPEPAPEWQEWKKCEGSGGVSYGYRRYPEDVVKELMPDGSPRFGGFVFIDPMHRPSHTNMTSHVLWLTPDGVFTTSPDNEEGRPVFAAYARMRTLPEGEKK